MDLLCDGPVVDCSWDLNRIQAPKPLWGLHDSIIYAAKRGQIADEIALLEAALEVLKRHQPELDK